MIAIGYFLPEKFLYFFTLEAGCVQIANVNFVLSVVATLVQVVVLAMMALLCVSETSQCIKWPTPTIVIGCFFGVCLSLAVHIFSKIYKHGVNVRHHTSMYWFTVWTGAAPILVILAIAVNSQISWIFILAGLVLLSVTIYVFLCTFSLYRTIKAENRMSGSSNSVEFGNGNST